MLSSKLLLSFCLMVSTPSAEGSSRELCYYKAEVVDVTKTHLVLRKTEIVVSPGFNAEMEKLRCTGKLNNERIALKEISKGKKLLKKDAKIKIEWSSYSSMTPKGPISGTTWKIKSAK